jgi:hypothetical protein
MYAADAMELVRSLCSTSCPKHHPHWSFAATQLAKFLLLSGAVALISNCLVATNRVEALHPFNDCSNTMIGVELLHKLLSCSCRPITLVVVVINI